VAGEGHLALVIALAEALADTVTESTDQVIGGQAVSDLRRLAGAAPEQRRSASRQRTGEDACADPSTSTTSLRRTPADRLAMRARRCSRYHRTPRTSAPSR
jgi:hypothetical protein